MGDMADMYDYGDTDDFWGAQEDCIVQLMELTDAELVAACAKSRAEKIVSICKQSKSGKALSEKQRFCLAFWIEEFNPEALLEYTG